MKKITWVLAHEPYEIFLNAANRFKSEVEKSSNISIDILTLQQWNQINAKNLSHQTVDREKIVAEVEQNTMQMATVYANTLGKKSRDFHYLSLPYLFENHSEAETYLDSEKGELILDSLSGTKLKGLCFTYSGGFRIIPSKVKIEKVEDFKNLKIRTSTTDIAKKAFRVLGAEPIQEIIDNFAGLMERNDVDGGETTYPRFFTMGHDKHCRYLLDVSHSLFLTSIVMNRDVWDSFTTDEQHTFKNAALLAAKIEREESIANIQSVRDKITADYAGKIELTEFSIEEEQKLKAILRATHEEFLGSFSERILK